MTKNGVLQVCCLCHVSILEVLKKIEKAKKGFVFIIDEDNTLMHVVTDGDIRRLLIQYCDVVKLSDSCLQFIQNKHYPVYINENNFEFSILGSLFMDNKITVLPIVNEKKQIVNYITKGEYHSAVLHNKFKGGEYNYRGLEKKKKWA